MKTRQVTVGDVQIGAGAPISIQTMGKVPMTWENVDFLTEQMHDLKKIGCHIIRFAIPDETVMEPLAKICQEKIMPIVADIHFDYKLALAALEAGVDKIRINPGNIGAAWKVEEVLAACLDKNIPIRVGINGGSLNRKYRHLDRVAAMLASAEEEIEILEKTGFKNALFSLKSSNVAETVEANTLFSSRWDYPLHLGVTEAGPLLPSLVKSSVALSRLLDKGIGDTIRISISDDLSTEVKAAREILKACGKSKKGATLISCPKCGRAVFDCDNKLAQTLEEYLYSVDKDITVAIMGCPVNGPGEAKEADLGVTGAGNEVIIFKKGELLKKIPRDKVIDILKEEIDKL